MAYEKSESILTREETAAVRQNAEERVSKWRRRAICFALALSLCCVSLGPFLEGRPLHPHAEPYARVLTYLAESLLLAFVYCSALWWGACRTLRDVVKNDTERP
jgi:hypothetical protein